MPDRTFLAAADRTRSRRRRAGRHNWAHQRQRHWRRAHRPIHERARERRAARLSGRGTTSAPAGAHDSACDGRTGLERLSDAHAPCTQRRQLAEHEHDGSTAAKLGRQSGRQQLGVGRQSGGMGRLLGDHLTVGRHGTCAPSIGESNRSALPSAGAAVYRSPLQPLTCAARRRSALHWPPNQ